MRRAGIGMAGFGGKGGGPRAPGISFSGTIEEGATTGRAVGTATLANPPIDFGTATWSELGTGTGAALFAIDGSTAAVTNTAAIDYETATSYTYGIQVTDGVYTYQDEVTISVTNIAVVPDAPTLTATAGNGEVTLSWTDAALPAEAPAITAHKLYMGTASGSLTLVGTIMSGSPYVVTGLTNGTAYYYKLSAVNAEGESALSTEQSATPSEITITGEIWAGLGDSTWEGIWDPSYARDAGVDTNWPNVYQVKLDNSLSSDTTPLASLNVGAQVEDRFSPFEYFGKRRAELTGRKVYLIQCAVGGSSVGGGDTEASQWQIGGVLHANAITRINAGIAAVKAAHPGAVFMGFTEEVGSNDTGYDPFYTRLLAAREAMHAAIYMNGVSGTTATGNVVHHFVTPSPDGHACLTPGYAQIDWALRDVSSQLAGGRYFRPGLGLGDLHWFTAGVRAVGTALADWSYNTSASDFTLDAFTIGSGDSYIQELVGDETAYWTVTGADAAKYEIIRDHYSLPIAGGNPDSARSRHYLRRKATEAHTTGTHNLIVNAKKGNGVVTSHGHTVTAGAATLTSAIDAANGSSGSDIGVTCALSSGTIYWAIYPASATNPTTGAQIQAGTGATISGSIAVSSAGAKTASPFGLSSSTSYKTAFAHKRPDGHWSAVVIADGFTTGAETSSWLAYHDPSTKANTAKGWGNLGTTTGDGSMGAGITILGAGGYASGKMVLGGSSVPPVFSDALINVGSPNIKIRQIVKVGPSWDAYIYGAVGYNGFTSGDAGNLVTHGVRMGTDGTCRLMHPSGDVEFGTFTALTRGNTYEMGIDIDQTNNLATFYVNGTVVLGPVAPPGRTILANNYAGCGGMYYDTGFEFGLLTVEAL